MVTEIDVSEVDEAIREEVKKVLIEIATTLTNNAKKEAPVNSGELRQSIQVLERGENEIIVGTQKNYAPFVEFGTEPHFPPIEPIKKWVHRKLGMGDDVAYAVQQKIGKEGTDANPFMQRAIEETRQEYI